MNRKAQGFTLIELLIVVAIIAILAAIAVPNFLEAQTRSKVSRTKADMRSLATAMESYRIDSNRYPEAYIAPNLTIDPRIMRFRRITTPIAYMTSVPEDVFSKDSSNTYSDREIRVFTYVDRASYVRYVNDALGTSDNGQNIYRVLWTEQLPGGQWILRSRGPKGDAGGVGSSVDLLDTYDPTNGTVSDGNIMYHGPGFGYGD